VVYQEFNLLPYLSVAENVFFEKLPSKGGLVNYRTLYRDTQRSWLRSPRHLAADQVELLGSRRCNCWKLPKRSPPRARC